MQIERVGERSGMGEYVFGDAPPSTMSSSFICSKFCINILQGNFERVTNVFPLIARPRHARRAATLTGPAAESPADSRNSSIQRNIQGKARQAAKP